MDVERYAKAFDTFLMGMNQISEPFSWEFKSVLEDVCELLRVGRIEMLFFENEQNENLGRGEFLTIYQKDTPSEECAFESRQLSGRGNVMIVRFYLKADEAKWSDEEAEKGNVLATMLISFNGRARLLKFVENSMLYDRELGVPNVPYIQREIGKLRAMDKIGLYGVGFFNLKRFSAINQALGREAGTAVMIEFLHELQQKIKQDGIVGRAGGDNFVVLFKKELLDVVYDHMGGTEIVYDKSDMSSVVVKANIGICLIEGVSDKNDDFVEKAHRAAQSARESVDKNCVIYDEELQAASDNANLIESIFRDAIENEEFLVYYQPKVELSDYKVAGAEALCRWFHGGKIVPPGDFIPVLEQSNAICVLDFYILEHVCRDIRRWLDEGLNAVKVSVNLSRRHMGDHKLLKKIMDIINKYDIPHSYIEIELTETTTDVGFNDLQRIVGGLHDSGITTSVDDFGVGYSSINLIRQVPWDIVKIDKSLVPPKQDLDSPQYVLFSHLISMFNAMGLKCVVEGVETIEQVQMLIVNHCYMAQGFFFDKPLPVAEFEDRLKDLHKDN